MKISVFGLGYVGCVGIGCLAKMGNHIIGVDVDQNKINNINKGKATIVEKDIEDIIQEYWSKNRISATNDSIKAVESTDISFICVGTPNLSNGLLDSDHIFSVAYQIASALRSKNTFHTIAIRSTVMPGTHDEIINIIEKESRKIHCEDFAVVSNPEFLREGSAVDDFFNPPYTVLASYSEKGIEIMKNLYDKVSGDKIVTSIGISELIKFVNNSYHGLKVAFANEVGRICKSLNVNSIELMELFCKDKILNISPYYFRPGFSYGGSCLPKDLKAFTSISTTTHNQTPILHSINTSNNIHIEYVLEKIQSYQIQKIGIVGISFKPGTDDLRFSPSLEICERLLGKGYQIKIYDKNVNISKLTGKNKEFLLLKLPHINKLLTDSYSDFFDNIGLIVLITNDQDLLTYFINQVKFEIKFLDLVGSKFIEGDIYEGVCW